MTMHRDSMGLCLSDIQIRFSNTLKRLYIRSYILYRLFQSLKINLHFLVDYRLTIISVLFRAEKCILMIL